MTQPGFNERLRQIIILMLILAIAVLLISQMVVRKPSLASIVFFIILIRFR